MRTRGSNTEARTRLTSVVIPFHPLPSSSVLLSLPPSNKAMPSRSPLSILSLCTLSMHAASILSVPLLLSHAHFSFPASFYTPHNRQSGLRQPVLLHYRPAPPTLQQKERRKRKRKERRARRERRTESEWCLSCSRGDRRQGR